MDQQALLARQFESKRAHLRGVAYRMLGSMSEADDAVQEAWLRLSRSDANEIDNIGGWLTTVVGRVCLDMLRARRARRDESLDVESAAKTVTDEQRIDPQHELLMADTIGAALLVVLERLAPAERIAFVLHDMFDLSFDEIGTIVGRTPTAARQLASRARRRVQGTPEIPEVDVAGQRKVVDTFLAAARSGDFEGLLAILDPEVVFRADAAAVRTGNAASETRGASLVAKAFSGRAQAARTALIDGAVGAIVAPNGRLFVVLDFELADGRIIAINAVADKDRLQEVEVGEFE